MSQSIVLLDNTTIYGAKYAYELYPPKVTDWLEGSNAVNLRSLMDVLESIVLYDSLIIDGSSRVATSSKEYYKEVYEEIWDDLSQTRDRHGGTILENRGFSLISKGASLTPILKATFEKLLRHIDEGTFTESVKKFQQEGLDFVLPKFYRDSREFSELFIKSFSDKRLILDVMDDLRKVEKILSNSTETESNYAMFAFRGFYYQELAHLFSFSYSPHTWRSNIIDMDTDKTKINFAKYVTEVTGQVRQELAMKLNNEFNTTIFSGGFPVISTYIAHQCRSRKELLNVALEIRETRSVRAFRKWIGEIQESVQSQSDLPKIANARAELVTTLKDIRKELGLETTSHGTEIVKIKMEVPIASVEIPLSIPKGLPDWLERIFHRRSHLLFLREITRKSVSLSPFAYRYSQLKP